MRRERTNRTPKISFHQRLFESHTRAALLRHVFASELSCGDCKPYLSVFLHISCRRSDAPKIAFELNLDLCPKRGELSPTLAKAAAMTKKIRFGWHVTGNDLLLAAFVRSARVFWMRTAGNSDSGFQVRLCPSQPNGRFRC